MRVLAGAVDNWLLCRVGVNLRRARYKCNHDTQCCRQYNKTAKLQASVFFYYFFFALKMPRIVRLV